MVTIKISHRDRARNAIDDGKVTDLAEKAFKTIL